MGKHEDSMPPNSDLYPEELQLKLYQAFIFSIPILFSIILCLLFYLFYLKRRANSMSSHHPTTQQSAASNQSASFLPPQWNLGIKGDLRDKLRVVLFDEELRARDSICCVCLGEYEMKEELRQLPLCKHVFHGDCICHWLLNNTTCPLCRCPVISTVKIGRHLGLGPRFGPTGHGNDDFAHQQLRENVGSNNNSNGLNVNIARSEQHVIQIAERTSSSVSISS